MIIHNSKVIVNSSKVIIYNSKVTVNTSKLIVNGSKVIVSDSKVMINDSKSSFSIEAQRGRMQLQPQFLQSRLFGSCCCGCCCCCCCCCCCGWCCCLRSGYAGAMYQGLPGAGVLMSMCFIVRWQMVRK